MGGPRAGLNAVKKKKSLAPARPVLNLSLYRLSYPVFENTLGMTGARGSVVG
jgi:hypothetical protein